MDAARPILLLGACQAEDSAGGARAAPGCRAFGALFGPDWDRIEGILTWEEVETLCESNRPACSTLS